MNVDTLGESLDNSVAKENLMGILGDLSDYTVQLLLEAGTAVPVFSYFVKGMKATAAIQDAIFLEKVIGFLRTVGEIPDKQRAEMIGRIQADEQYRQKFGKFSIIALSRYDDELKAKYLGMAACYLAREEISYDFYQRFSHIIDQLPIYDLVDLTTETFLNYGKNTFYAFEALGLIHTALKLPGSVYGGKIGWKTGADNITVSHRRLTDWGVAVKNILLEKPVAAKL